MAKLGIEKVMRLAKVKGVVVIFDEEKFNSLVTPDMDLCEIGSIISEQMQADEKFKEVIEHGMKHYILDRLDKGDHHVFDFLNGSTSNGKTLRVQEANSTTDFLEKVGKQPKRHEA